jgi:hypothetical protein
LDIGGLKPRELGSGNNINTYVGSPLGVFFLTKWAGVDPVTGKEQIYDLEGNIITLADSLYETRNASEAINLLDSLRQPIFDKQSMPKFFGGFTNKVTWKNFDLDVLITYNYGNWILDQGERQQSYVSGKNNLRESVITDPNGPTLLYSMITKEQGFALSDPFSQRNTTRFLHDGSYVRVKTVSIGYTLPQEVLSKLKLSNMRIYVTAQNLFTFTKFKGWDPEVLTNLSDAKSRNIGTGITTYDFPQVKTFIAGLSVGF